MTCPSSVEDNKINHTLIPFIQCDDVPGVILMDDSQVEQFNTSIAKLNDIISEPSLLKEEHTKLMRASERSQRYVFCPFSNKYLAALYVRGYIPEFFSVAKLRVLQNKIMCESHRERILYYLSNKLK